MTLKNDLQAIDDLTADLYRSICFEKGGRPPVDKLHDLFIPQGLMINNSEETPLLMSVESFIQSFRSRIEDGTIVSFMEKELSNITEIFGKIAHRFSTYETKFDLTREEPFTVGINSIQFVEIGGRWLISSIVWNNQTEDRIIPEKYLNAAQ